MENVIHNLKEHIYRPVEIPRYANLQYLVTAESVDEILKIGCIRKNTPAAFKEPLSAFFIFVHIS